MQPEKNQNTLQRVFQSMGLGRDVSTLPASIAGETKNFKPGKKWNPYFLKRNGGETQYDIVKGFESYVDFISDVFYHTDNIMKVRSAANYYRRTYAPEDIRETLSWAEELRYATRDRKVEFLRDNDVISSATAMSPSDIDQAMDDYVDKLYRDIKQTTKYSDLTVYL